MNIHEKYYIQKVQPLWPTTYIIVVWELFNKLYWINQSLCGKLIIIVNLYGSWLYRTCPLNHDPTHLKRITKQNFIPAWIWVFTTSLLMGLPWSNNIIMYINFLWHHRNVANLGYSIFLINDYQLVLCVSQLPNHTIVSCFTLN